MRISETPLQGVFVVEPTRILDERGSFARTFCEEVFGSYGMNPHVAQANVSVNTLRGTLRGLHYQRDPHGETKLVRVTRGAIFDVVVDLRPTSPTFKRWFAAELTAENGHAIYVPLGVAHGFQTLVDDTEILYLMGARYEPSAAAGVRFDDPAFGIIWPLPPIAVSSTDRSFPPVAG